VSDGPERFPVSVGHLAEFVHRGGDIGPRGTPSVTALEGLRRQQRAQRSAGATYRSEVRLAGRWNDAGIVLEITGRADGLLEGQERVRIEEMKTHRGDVERLRRQEGRAHEAQLLLYGALWEQGRAEDDRRPLALELVYLDADTDACTRRCVGAERAALLAFLDETCRRYAAWLVVERRRRARRDALLAELPFPAAGFRPGQRVLARRVWRALSEESVLLAQAPTGIGKTLGVLYAALRRLPGQSTERLLYLTPRGSARALALDAVRRMDPEAAALRAVELVARERICPWPGTPCRAVDCERAAGHFDRRRAALTELLDQAACRGAVLTRERIATVSATHRVCPAALQHDAARFADLVVGDYNYAFDPFARQRALLEREDGGAALLVDEAHNLPERARAMHSAELDRGQIDLALREARRLGAVFARALERVSRMTDAAAADHPAPLLEALEALLPMLGHWLSEAPAGPPHARFEALRRALARFLELCRLATGERRRAFLLHYEPDAGGRLRLQCLDAGPFLRDARETLGGLVLFSATLAPPRLRRLELGLDEDAAWLALPDPYPPQRRRLLLLRDIDLRARARSGSLPALVEAVVDVVDARAGHYLLFAPSFAFLDEIAHALAARRPEWVLQRQRPGMDETERQAFLAALRRLDGGGTRVACAVSGGLFAEGVDLPGDALIGVIVAGLPLPPPDVERLALADYHGAAGRDIAFRAPAVTRILQAAGRLVRSEQDAGVVCIADARLREQAFLRLLPSDWRPEVLSAREAGGAAREFWARLNTDAANHAQDQDHLHHRPGDRELPGARGALRSGHERGAPEHVARGSRLGGAHRELGEDAESQGAPSRSGAPRHPGAGDPHRRSPHGAESQQG
jgi:DNA excision repair protein ERCC-2